ncbi:TonB-dependent receptor domain-containing protein [Catenovulum sediminis]|uniref:TonB-dependent receptor n=1 Tax=Catenovulum sediminis TaxID=1740262 RepID=A0ABV1RGF1_9ALTE
MQNIKSASKNFTSNLLTAAIVSSFVAPPVFAAENNKKSDLDDIEMIQVKGQATSGLDRLIGQDELEKLQANDLADIFRLDTSVNVGGSVGMSQKIYLRNVGEDMLHISIDGAEIAEAVFHHAGRVTVEPEILKQVEIEAGTGSAAVGPGALGGAVRLTTKNPIDMLTNGENFGGILKASHFSNGSGNKVSVTAYGADDDRKLSGLVNLVSATNDNFEAGDGNEIVGSGADKMLGYLKGVAYITDGQYLSVSYENLEEEGDILYKPELIPSHKNWISPTQGTRESIIVNYGYDDLSSDLLNFRVTAYQSNQEQTRYYDEYLVEGTVESKGINVQNKSEFSNIYLVYGLNYRRDESALAETPTHEEGKVIGVFAQSIIQVTDALTLSAGSRFDEYELTDWLGQEISDSGFSPNLSASYQLTEKLGISAGFASAMRGPKVKDSYKVGYYSNDPNLKAETATNLEFGLDYQGDNFELGIGRYQSTIKDPIGNMAPWGKVAENLAHDLETEGVYLQFDLNLGNFYLHTDINHATTEFNGDKATRYFHSSTATTMGDNYILDLSYVVNDKLTLGWVTQYVESVDPFEVLVDAGGPYEETLTASKQGYTLHDLYASWQPLDALKVNLAVKNLLDKTYLSQGSVEDLTHNAGYEIIAGQNSVGRDIRLTVSYDF